MTRRLPIEAAEAAFRDLGGFAAPDSTVPPPARLLDAVRRFAAVEFEVSTELPDQDGLLFQYATVGATGDAAFVLSVVRQFEVVDADGDHEEYVQLHAEYRFGPDPEWTGHHEDWWFRGGPEPFDDWFARISAHPVWGRFTHSPPTGFEISQETV
ncbi:hypothetical protein GA0074696_3041 [Micromonospora purpureochromogenes]|uniref:Uncharacterized protein n=1 Tax=Micromonospora purpureochromogenes TaxID=47872 RepID=A0A1C4Y4E4_9ACTN|nr:hypothetical protein [Micromonospora purpureochromogenes]SCF15550.1 hypothetical protein GA0074696_3041 [Micromonospora purpureochromogenes]